MSDMVEILPRPFVERIARIVGSSSAAAQAIRCADAGEYGDDPVFCRPVDGRNNFIMVTAKANCRAPSTDSTKVDA